MANPLLDVQKFGQSIWYDNIRRGLITSGELAGMVEQRGLLGVTSNPAIFEKAITGSIDYDQAIKALVAQGVQTSKDVYERLAVQDVQLAADVLYPTYVRTGFRDGYVSLEVSPYLAHETKATIDEARRLHADVRRDNVLIKVPATPAGVPAIRQLISEGISVNVTLLFAVEAYEQVADAYLAGLEAYHAKGGDVSRVASVASFFVSRVDTLVDSRLERMLDATTDPEKRKKLKSLVGKVAIANARLAYARYRDIHATDRWRTLAELKAMPQRLLWASTGVKNPKYSPTLYVDELIGPDTVNTVPAETFVAFEEHGRPRASLTENWAENLDSAHEIMRVLGEVGIPFSEVTQTLLDDAVKKFCDPFDVLLASVEKKRQTLLSKSLDSQTLHLGECADAVRAGMDDWRINGKVRRLWAGDSSLWTGTDEGDWLAWLHAPETHVEHAEHVAVLADDVKRAGFAHVVVLGMGGSSLTPEVLGRIFGPAPGFPELIVLDSTVPSAISKVDERIDPTRTLFVVSSKSGGTLETGALFVHFLERLRKSVGPQASGQHFVAITDPRTRLHTRAKADRFLHIFHSLPHCPGRFSALTNLGLVPATLLGLDVKGLLKRAAVMLHSCASCVPPELNPGVSLGVAIGTLARSGRDKLTLALAPELASLGPWLEQLVSESLGKDGKGVVLIDGEPLAGPDAYGKDRAFVQVRLLSAPSAEQDRAVQALQDAGFPVVRISLAEVADVGQELFRWQMATAVAGSVLGVNPFSAPDVEAAKLAARSRVAVFENTGSLPAETPLASEGGISLFADGRNTDVLLTVTGGRKDVTSLLRAHLGRLQTGDYFALNAFVEQCANNQTPLQTFRVAVRNRHKVATTLGYGPRLLHSTGQLHKGGPNSGLFVQVTADDAQDLPIPGQKYSFGVLSRAQALGDFEVLAARGRRALRVHLEGDVAAGLRKLAELGAAALA